MGFHQLFAVVFLAVAFVVASNAAISPQLYWESKLSHTPMPKALSSLLSQAQATLEQESTSVNVRKGENSVKIGRKGSVGVIDTEKATGVGVGKGGVIVNTPGKHGKPPVYVGVTPSADPFVYLYAATETQFHDNSNVAKFFLEEDMHKGTTMNLKFKQNSEKETFLPRQVAENVPFSTSKLPEILNYFSVKPESVQAETMRNTIKECESPGIKGEKKYCATSLESMVDFSTSQLGKDPKAISTEVEKPTGMLQKYTIGNGVKHIRHSKSVVCHKMKYTCPVFYCHSTQAAKAYVVPLEAENGTKAKAVAVCHTDTSSWNPKHLAFQVLNVKPGDSPDLPFPS